MVVQVQYHLLSQQLLELIL